ncbi:MAG: four helix bundle protein [Bacteroidetes bacterium GWF2_43_63]|nr:MAG: four helix bundle protein [Bacteroidetes bacterium GWE2_42_42]OFY56071.1 MAG: four helix bundle protein [Bacteroidetes bacterium GWF2_43_63]HBG70677.1 four helix bundle protein [Bacteroidales bacterium]HCB62495.1 four helix bundle protein [Bacteroidales bacterium]HCY21950.1 four helix bundle protein [Bacteroidales bacterium]
MYTSFNQMPVWKTAFDLSVEVFNLTATLPKSEDYGLTSQLRRSANSVGANISEGFGRVTGNDKAYFYAVSRGSAYETKHHLRYGCAVGYFDKDVVAKLIMQYEELINSLNKIIKTMRR